MCRHKRAGGGASSIEPDLPINLLSRNETVTIELLCFPITPTTNETKKISRNQDKCRKKRNRKIKWLRNEKTRRIDSIVFTVQPEQEESDWRRKTVRVYFCVLCSHIAIVLRVQLYWCVCVREFDFVVYAQNENGLKLNDFFPFDVRLFCFSSLENEDWIVRYGLGDVGGVGIRRACVSVCVSNPDESATEERGVVGRS